MIECFPENCNAWIQYAELERTMEEHERCRAIYLIASEENLDMPENLWKSFLDYEVEMENHEYARSLYSLLLSKTHHLKVYLSFANFESSINEYVRARVLFNDAYLHFKTHQMNEERVMVLENWLQMEEQTKNEELIKKVQNMMPKRIKKRRKIQNNNNDLQDESI